MTIRFIKSVRVGMALIAGLAIAGPSVAQTLEWRHVQGGKYGGGFFLDADRGWLTADAHIMYTTDGETPGKKQNSSMLRRTRPCAWICAGCSS